MEWKCLDWSSSFLSLPPRYSYFTVTEGIIGLSYAVRGKLRLRRLPAPLCGWFLGERYYEKFAKRELSSFCSSSAKKAEKEREKDSIHDLKITKRMIQRSFMIMETISTKEIRIASFKRLYIFVGTGEREADILGITPANNAHIDSNSAWHYWR